MSVAWTFGAHSYQGTVTAKFKLTFDDKHV